MTEHTYYECDICGTKAEKFSADIPTRRVRNMADFLLENTNVQHICRDCINEIVPAARQAVKNRYGVNKSNEGE